MTLRHAPDRWLPVVALLFFGSGAAALVYEIVWLQLLELFVGSSAVSVGVLLGTFMGGMCLGSLLLPRLVSARRHPLRVYAALETAIGVLGVLLLFAMPLVGRIYTAWGGYGLGGFLLRGLVAALCLLPPTIAMGATLPAVARWVETTPRGVSWLGVFYAGNIAGAVFGCLLAGFYLLRVYDMATATYVAASVNIEVAVLAYLMASARGSPVETIAAPREGESAAAGLDAASPPGARVIYVAIALSGFCALAAEVVWTRLLALLLGATVYTFAIILAVYLLGLGLGSVLGALAARTVGNPRAALGWCQLAIVAGLAWSALMLARSLPYWPINVALSRSVWFNFQLDVARALWAILPAPILWGASFPLALASVARPGRDPGRLVGAVYAANTLGAIAGALGASLLLIAWVGTQHAQQLLMAGATLAGLILLVPPLLAAGSPRRLRGASALAVAAATAVAVVLIARVPRVPGILVAYGRYAATWLERAGEMLFVGEGLNASVAVSRAPGGLLQYHSAGKVQASSLPSDMRLQRMLGHLTTLVPRDPRSVLVIGCGAGVTAGAVSIDPRVERVTIAEIEPLVPRVVATYFGATNYDVVKSPKVRIVLDDARHFLLTSREKFDAITSDPLDPWVKGAATLYTKEFFEAARAHLTAGGVVTVFVQLYESSPEAVKSEVATFFEVFPRGVVWGNTHLGRGYDMVLLGQAGPAAIDLDAMDARLRDPAFAAVQRSLAEIGMGSAVDLLATFGGRAVDLREWLADAAINRDRDLRLQYLAGLGLNQYQSASIYADMVRYRRFPEDLFSGSEALKQSLRAAVARAPGGAAPGVSPAQGTGR